MFKEKEALDAGFFAAFGEAPTRYFSAPGRTELGGNHTDHQLGRVLAAAVDLHTVAAVRPTGRPVIRVQSAGYPLCQISLSQLQPQPGEEGTTASLIRGVAAGSLRAGYEVGGFDAYVMSTVLPGSGLSSSAAFEVLIGTVISGLFRGGTVAAETVAAIGQYAENTFFGKPCGLMDQMACAVGGLVEIDFSEGPKVRQVAFDFSAQGHALCIIDTGADHADLTEEYAAIPREMGEVAALFGETVLSRVPEAVFFSRLPQLRQTCGDRAVLRAIHFYQEQARVTAQAAALERGDFPAFLELVRESGRSSWCLLQNVTVSGSVRQQPVALALALCERLLEGAGACRVHGGGFAGTVQAFVPVERLDAFRTGIEAVLGPGSCHVLSIRLRGGVELRADLTK